MIVFTVLFPMLFGWLCLETERAGWLGAEAAIAMFAIGHMALFGALGRSALNSLHRTDTERRRTEADLRDYSERISIASQAAGHGFWQFDIDTNTLRWDDQMFRNYGRDKTPGDLPYAVWVGSLHPEDRARTELELTDAMDGSRPFDTEFRVVHPDGSIRHLKTLARVMRDAEGRAIRMFGVNFDITERKQAETSNARALERLNEAQRIAQVGDWVYDLVTRTVNWSAQVYEIFGRDPRSGPPRGPHAMLVTDDPHERSILEEKIARVIRTGEVQNHEYSVVRPNGEPVHVHGMAVARKDTSGKVVAVFGTVQDISERKHAERLARESNQRYRFLSEKMPQIVWTSTPDGNLDYFNQRWYDYTGLTILESKDSGWQSRLHPEDLPNCSRWTQAYTTGVDYEMECRFKRASDGAYRWHLGRASPLRNLAGEIIQWVGTFTDIDDQKSAAQALSQARATLEQRVLERTRELGVAKDSAELASTAKSEFLANMSHEIRTPLNALIGLGYLLEQTTLTEDQRQFVNKIQFAGRSLLSVVNNVLDLSKIEVGEMALEDEAFDLQELVREISQMLSPQASAKGIELIVRPAKFLPLTVIGDAARLRQILINLVNNAIKFTAVGHVELTLRRADQGHEHFRLRCEVTDTGIGIEPAGLERLFTPFTQADPSTTRRFGGTGLGLSISRRFVELMGGEIGVTSTVDVGSTFWFEIPLRVNQDEEHPPRADATHSRDAAHGMRILIADSQGSSQAGVGAIIRALGWRPQIVRTLDKLLGALRTTDAAQWPDVLIVESRPHDADARQLIAQFEKEHSFAEMPPCILVTDIEQSYVEYRKSMRTEDVLLVRPVSSSAIFNAINSAVWKRRDSYARMLNSTNFGETRAQWLVGVRVLAVDDSEVNLEVAQRILERQGAIVTTCSDGAAALDYVRAHHSVLDLVLMDVQMPVMDGNDATRRIRGELNLPDLPIIALTAGALVGERKRALEAGMSDFVSKPFDPQTLIRKARHLVEQARGEPIHVSVLQTRESERETSGGVLMSSVDAGIVQQTFGDDLSLFTSVLSRILREFADFALPISGLGDCEQRNRLKLRAHKLKGSAGMIGAMRVMRLAGAVEAALSKNRPDEAVEKILRLLASALTTLREEAEPFLARQSKHVSRTPAPAAAPGGASRGAIDDLFGLLETQNLAADEKFSALAPSLRDCMDAAGFDRLRAAMDNLDFQLAAELLRGVLPALARPN